MKSTAGKPAAIHYAWIIVICGAVVIFASFGLARYAYSMLLPAMQQELGFDYGQMGMIGTANFSGYLIAVLFTPYLINRYKPRLVISAGLLIVALTLCLLGNASHYLTILILYGCAGFGGGLCNIPMMALLTLWFTSTQRGKAVGIVVCGNGAGIMFTGFLIPFMSRQFQLSGWRYSWEVLGGVVFVCACLVLIFLRNHPAELGLRPLGWQQLSQCASLPEQPQRKNQASVLLRLGLLYFVFGLTFMIYGTFIVETMMREFGLTQAQAGSYWSWIGGISFFSGVVFGTLSDRIGRKHAIAIVFAVQTVAYSMVGLMAARPALLLSVICYGIAVFAIPTIMAAAAGDYFGTSRAATALATITIFFATGQALGPACAGVMIDRFGDFSCVYLLAAILTSCAACGALTLPAVSQR